MRHDETTDRFVAGWVTHDAVECAKAPRIRIRRLASSITIHRPVAAVASGYATATARTGPNISSNLPRTGVTSRCRTGHYTSYGC